jgi:L-ascorbate metabolism protein UlaG (beta-lactamase superfamily)
VLGICHCSCTTCSRQNARKAVAIHWGTWDLSNEPISEPPRMLGEARDKVGLTQEQFDICALGGSVSV